MILHQQFKQVVVLYGEDAEKTTILDFFTIFSNFLTSFNVSHWCSEIVNWNLKFNTAYMAYSMVAKLIPLVTKYGSFRHTWVALWCFVWLSVLLRRVIALIL